MTKPTLLFYCQHLLGMGHLMRSRALVTGMLQDFDVTFLNGGELIPGFAFPDAVQVINLPPLKADTNFTTIEASGGQRVTSIKAVRTSLLLDTYATLQPDLLVIELFPFGRKKFAFELLPLLAQIRRNAQLGIGKSTKVICSLRDIMVSRRDQWKHEARACRILNRYFDQLLIHADPAFQPLEESFGQMAALTTPHCYTGYVAQTESDAGEGDRNESQTEEAPIPLTGDPLFVASIGGGRVGSELLAAAAGASALLRAESPHQLLIFTGPYIPDAEFAMLERLVAGQPQITLRRYTNQFLSYLGKADLSLSMAGYNTTMNIMVTGVNALLLPFTGGDNDEQLIRVTKLAALRAVGQLTPADLTPQALTARIQTQLANPTTPIQLDLDGVVQSAAVLRSLVDRPTITTRFSAADTVPAAGSLPAVYIPVAVPGEALITERLQPFLDRWSEAHGQPIRLFMRDDDINEDEATLRELLDVSLACAMPINLEVIPGSLTDACTRLIADHKRFTPKLVQLDQHGWLHTNHEREGRKCEFGPSRSYAQQYDDIARGKALLETTLPELISPVFTPPWNRCTADTYRALDELGFAIFSGLRGKRPVTGYRFREISVTLDLYRWKGGATMKDPAEIIDDLCQQIVAGAPIGLLLHHKVMDRAAFAFLDRLLTTLLAHPFVHGHTFETLQPYLAHWETNQVSVRNLVCENAIA